MEDSGGPRKKVLGLFLLLCLSELELYALDADNGSLLAERLRRTP